MNATPRRRAVLATTLSVLTVSACAGKRDAVTTSDSTQAPTNPSPHTTVVSLLGKPLTPPPIPEQRREHLERELARYRAAIQSPSASEDDFIWYARTLGYLHRYQDDSGGESAIKACTDGLATYPSSYKLLRHRGHRYITVRRFDLAEQDLARAAELIEQDRIPDEIEPDGAPNSRGIPRSTSHTNIYYHLGLARYLKRDYDGAAHAFRMCLIWSQNDDMLCAATNWLYCSLRRAGHERDAALVLQPIRVEMELFENQAYHALCLLYKGELTAQSLTPIEEGGDPSLQDATVVYGLANDLFMNGDREGANARWRQVIDYPSWPAFGVIAAEAELAPR